MTRTLLLSALLHVTAAATAAAQLIVSPPQRVAPHRTGAADLWYAQVIGVVDVESGVLAVTGGTMPLSALSSLWTTQIDGTGRVEVASERTIGAADAAAVGSIAGRTMVVWRDGQRIVASPLLSDGTLQYAEGKLLGAAPRDGNAGPMSCNASRCAVRLGSELLLVDADADIVAKAALPAMSTPLAADPNGFLLTPDTAPTRHVIRIDNEGVVTADVTIAAYPLAADFDGSAYTVVSRSDDASSVDARPLTLDGTLGAPRRIFELRTGEALSGVSIAWNGATHFVAIAAGNASTSRLVIAQSWLYGVRLDDMLAPRDERPLIVSAQGKFNAFPKVAPLGDGFYVAWAHGALPSILGATTTLGARIDAAGAVAPFETLRHGATAQLSPRAACSESQCLVVWADYDPAKDGSTLFGRRLGDGGTPLDAPFEIADQASPVAVAALGSDALVVWRETVPERPNLRGAIVRGDGTFETLAIDALQSPWAQVASDGTGWVVIGTAPDRSVVSVRVTRSGLVSPAHVLMNDATAAALASNGDGFVALAIRPSAWPYEVFAIAMNGDGAAASPPHQIAPLAYAAAIAANGRDYLVATQPSTAVELFRLSSDAVASSQPVRTEPRGNVLAPALLAVVPLGSGWLLRWRSDDTWAMRIDGSGRPVEAPFRATELGPAAITPKEPNTLVAMELRAADGAAAVFYREVRNVPRLRRRATVFAGPP